MKHTDLVIEAQAGGLHARERLLGHLLPEVLQWCHRMGGPTVDAEDAAHDVLVVVLSRLHTLRDPERLFPWTFGITRKVLASHRRRAWVKRWVPSFAISGADDGSPSPERLAAMSETARGVWTALGNLTDQHREVLVLCDIEERTDQQVAELLEVPVGTVKSRLRRARRQFRLEAEVLELAWCDLPTGEGAR